MGAEVAFLTSALMTVATTGISVAQQQAATRFENAVLRQRAELARRRAALEARQYAGEQSRLLATQRARLAQAGVELNTGSPVEVQTETAARADFQRRLILAGGTMESQRMLQQAGFNAARQRAWTNRAIAGATVDIASAGLNTPNLLD